MKPFVLPELGDLIDAASRSGNRRSRDGGADRRVHPRLSAPELTWIRRARLKNGPELAIVDLSSGGALVDARVQMRPGARLTLELGARHGIVDLPSEVLRCRIASLEAGSAVYRGACRFHSPVSLADMLEPQADPAADAGSDAAIVEAATPAVTDNWHHILVRYRDGGIVKGFTIDFHPGRTYFSVWPATDGPTSSRVLVPMSRLKAVAFLGSRENHPPVPGLDGTAIGPGRGIEVTFVDREVLRGVTPTYRPHGAGFFVRPLADANAHLVFVARSAVRHVRFQ